MRTDNSLNIVMETEDTFWMYEDCKECLLQNVSSMIHCQDVAQSDWKDTADIA